MLGTISKISFFYFYYLIFLENCPLPKEACLEILSICYPSSVDTRIFFRNCDVAHLLAFLNKSDLYLFYFSSMTCFFFNNSFLKHAFIRLNKNQKIYVESPQGSSINDVTHLNIFDLISPIIKVLITIALLSTYCCQKILDRVPKTVTSFVDDPIIHLYVPQ